METVSRRLQLSGGMQISTVLADLSTGGIRSFYRQGGRGVRGALAREAKDYLPP